MRSAPPIYGNFGIMAPSSVGMDQRALIGSPFTTLVLGFARADGSSPDGDEPFRLVRKRFVTSGRPGEEDVRTGLRGRMTARETSFFEGGFPMRDQCFMLGEVAITLDGGPYVPDEFVRNPADVHDATMSPSGVLLPDPAPVMTLSLFSFLLGCHLGIWEAGQYAMWKLDPPDATGIDLRDLLDPEAEVPPGIPVMLDGAGKNARNARGLRMLLEAPFMIPAAWKDRSGATRRGEVVIEANAEHDIRIPPIPALKGVSHFAQRLRVRFLGEMIEPDELPLLNIARLIGVPLPDVQMILGIRQDQKELRLQGLSGRTGLPVETIRRIVDEAAKARLDPFR